ncbi:MAG: aldo/keto reductase [Candidatus Heimdallarchaeaceae archaeon]
MIPKLKFGRTGHISSRILFGSYALSKATQEEANQVLNLLLKNEINHIDTAPRYGKAEKLIGPWMEKHRKDFFLATKTRNRGYEGAWQDLHNSLEILKVDYIDLWQMHGLTNPQGQEKAMGPEGALQAFKEARDQGLVCFLGVTGHGNLTPMMHKKSLEYFDFDTVLLPYNYLLMKDKKYSTTFNELVEICQERNVAIQTIKSVAARNWEGQVKDYNTYFYEPIVNQEAIDKAVHWAMGFENSFVISAGDMQILPKMLEAANRYKKTPTDEIMNELVEEHNIKKIF